MTDYREVNRANWDERVPAHVASPHDSAPWNALPGLMTADEDGEWRLTDNPRRLPATYTLRAHKPTLQARLQVQPG